MVNEVCYATDHRCDYHVGALTNLINPKPRPTPAVELASEQTLMGFAHVKHAPSRVSVDLKEQDPCSTSLLTDPSFP